MSRGHDGTVTPINNRTPPPTMQGIVIGGVANGVLLKSLKQGTEAIELGTPTHLRPLTSSNPNAEAEVARATDRYYVNTFYLPGDDRRVLPFALVILEGKTPAWAMTQLVKGFVMQTTDEIKKETIQT